MTGAGVAPPAPGAVELREDVPLQAPGAGGAGTACTGGPRPALACFAVLSAAITLALFTQIYYGDYEVVPHGGVASGRAACSAVGTRALKAGGGALDAAAASALCLAVLAPHLTSLDASGALLYWEYRSAEARARGPELAEWGGPEGAGGGGGERPPRLLAALAVLHARHGRLRWRDVLQPAVDLAKRGFPASAALAAALAARAGGGEEPAAGATLAAPALAAYLASWQRNTSAELARVWDGAVHVRGAGGGAVAAGGWRLYAGGAGTGRAGGALAAALRPPPVGLEDASARVIAALQEQAAAGAGPGAGPGGVATGLAVVDSRDTYVALVMGLSVPFGSEGAEGEDWVPGEGQVLAGGGQVPVGGGQNWARDVPRAPLDLAPAILLDDHVCGTRFVLGAESSAALAQAAAALAVSGDAAAVERPRVALAAGGALAAEAGRPAPPAAALPPGVAALAASAPAAAVNVVRQRGDALLSHADGRGGGVASRF